MQIFQMNSLSVQSLKNWHYIISYNYKNYETKDRLAWYVHHTDRQTDAKIVAILLKHMIIFMIVDPEERQGPLGTYFFE